MYKELADGYGFDLEFYSVQDFKFTPLFFQGIYGKKHSVEIFKNYKTTLGRN